ncbi:LOW QUALITY PROTEIN: hypothetical protein Cgig2_018416 [Carnegiea gigantea]|uniref:Uncharacterized protein n=1 Tax=Carnegiea gigantea TaxID=171969 RepID=A0A9Q1JTK8_9CARY|nr:LOW QUALITY PROTEIN: hypothetical protein Cgig2_018416 [Carnegiea gigantea]
MSLFRGFDYRDSKRESEAVRRQKFGGACEALRREKCEGGSCSHNTEDREQEWGFFSSKSVRKKRNEHNNVRKKKSNARWRTHGELKTESTSEAARKKKNRTGRGREEGGGAGPCKNAWWSEFKVVMNVALCCVNVPTMAEFFLHFCGYRLQPLPLIGKGIQGAGCGDTNEQLM